MSASFFVRISATKRMYTRRPLQAVSLPGDFESAIKETQAAIPAWKVWKFCHTTGSQPFNSYEALILIHQIWVGWRHICLLFWGEHKGSRVLPQFHRPVTNLQVAEQKIRNVQAQQKMRRENLAKMLRRWAGEVMDLANLAMLDDWFLNANWACALHAFEPAKNLTSHEPEWIVWWRAETDGIKIEQKSNPINVSKHTPHTPHSTLHHALHFTHSTLLTPHSTLTTLHTPQAAPTHSRSNCPTQSD